MTDQSTQETQENAYDGFAIVELMRHRRTAGLVTEISQFGATMIRVDAIDPESETVEIVNTQFYGGAAIYCLSPCDEAAARALLRRSHGLPDPVRLALNQVRPAIEDHSDDHEEHF